MTFHLYVFRFGYDHLKDSTLKKAVIFSYFYTHSVRFQSLFCLWVERDGAHGRLVGSFWLLGCIATFIHLQHSSTCLLSKGNGSWRVTKQSGQRLKFSPFQSRLVSQQTTPSSCQALRLALETEAETVVIAQEWLLFRWGHLDGSRGHRMRGDREFAHNWYFQLD